jgi:GNAT superfamily N-acetyltransferase
MTSGTVRVRNVARTDFDQWLPLWEGYNSFYERVGPKAVPTEVTRTTWSRFFDHYEPVHCLVAEDASRIVGIVHFIFHRNTSMIGPTCYLQDIFTKQDMRGKGVGRALIEGVYERARTAGATRVYWQTHETNTTAQRLYESVAARSGFIVYRKDL